MNKGRLEAFSDGVLAIIITIMVLEIKVPHGGNLNALKSLIPVFLSYVLSFIYIGIYWNNHHHLFQAVKQISGSILWANLHLLFWLSLIPFVTGWVGENHFSETPMALYGGVLLMAAVASAILKKLVLSEHGADSLLSKALEKGVKEKLSLVLYVLAIPLAFVNPWISAAMFIIVALIWIVPDKRIENALKKSFRT